MLPTLVMNGVTLGESLPILEYLGKGAGREVVVLDCGVAEETIPEPPILPSDSEQRLRVRQICQLIAADIQPVQVCSSHRSFLCCDRLL